MPAPLRSARFALLCLAPLGACDPTTTAPDAGSDAGSDAPVAEPDAAPDPMDAGPPRVEAFATLGASSEGIALGRAADGSSRLFVATRDDRIVAVAPDGTVADVASLRAPVGIAVRSTGEIVACASSEDGRSGLFEVALDGTVTELTTSGPDGPYMLANFVAVAPDGSLVFSDSAGDRVYHADADGGNVRLVSDAIDYANGLAFSEDASQLFVASWNTTTLYALPYDGTSFGAPAPLVEGILNVDGIVRMGPELVLVTSNRGGLVVDPRMPAAEPRTLFERADVLVPANAVFGDETFGTTELFVTSLGRPTLFVVHTDR
jgi:sugar lactone lactonase YvrE